MRRTCQGYCGGDVEFVEAQFVGPDAEVFCEDCAERADD